MGTINDALKGLFDQEGSMPLDALATKVGTGKDTLRKQLSTLKGKGYVDGNSTDGWIITSEGRASVEREEKIPLTPKDVGADTESKLKYYGQLATVPSDIILATVELIMTGDPENLEHVWDCMSQMDVPISARRRWFALWRNYLKQGIPPTIRERVVGTIEETGEGGEEEAPSLAKDRGRDYIIVDDIPVFVGPGQGDFSLRDAKDIIGIRAIRARVGATSGGSGQQWGPKELVDLIDKIEQKRGDGAAGKTYVAQYTEQGVVFREVQPGEPVAIGPPPGSKSPKTILINPDGTTTEVEPGHPVVLQQHSNPPPAQKTTVVRQTDKGLVTEEYEPGKVIVLGGGSPGGGGMPMLPFPVFGDDGKPVTDSEGRPIYANLEPTLRWLTFQGDQRRADEKNQMLAGLVQTVKENLGDGIAALKAAAEEAKSERGGQTSSEAPQPVYECSECHTQFTIPAVEFEKIGCPKCRHEYTREEVLSV